uniref:Putative secreted protein n=1 Tax=Anopheles triannulatus TaxID=58253 RepID=A0A2M4B596_9DIPT
MKNGTTTTSVSVWLVVILIQSSRVTSSPGRLLILSFQFQCGGAGGSATEILVRVRHATSGALSLPKVVSAHHDCRPVCAGDKQ